MKLLKIEGNGALDSILMVVPDDYDELQVFEMSMELIDPVIVEEINIGDTDKILPYHPYTG